MASKWKAPRSSLGELRSLTPTVDFLNCLSSHFANFVFWLVESTVSCARVAERERERREREEKRGTVSIEDG